MFNPSDLLDHLQRLSPTPQNCNETESAHLGASHEHSQGAHDMNIRGKSTGGSVMMGSSGDDHRGNIPDYPTFDQVFHHGNGARMPPFANSASFEYPPHSNSRSVPHSSHSNSQHHNPFAHPSHMFMMGAAANMFPGQMPFNAMNPMMYRDAPPMNSSSGPVGPSKSSASEPTKGAPAKKEVKRRRKKPRDCPKRPLSAYNLFFKDERKRILESIPGENQKKKQDDVPEITWPGKKKTPHRKIGFENVSSCQLDFIYKALHLKLINFFISRRSLPRP